MEQIFREDAYQTRCEATVVAADESGIRLDRTVFYPMGMIPFCPRLRRAMLGSAPIRWMCLE